MIKLKEALDRSEYGRISAYAHNSVKQFFGDLMAYVSYPTPAVQNGGGELMNLGSHTVDALLWFFGMPNRVSCQMQNLYFEEYAQFGTEDIATLWCEYPDFTATLTAGRSKARSEDATFDCVNITGEGAWVQVDRMGYSVNGNSSIRHRPEQRDWRHVWRISSTASSETRHLSPAQKRDYP